MFALLMMRIARRCTPLLLPRALPLGQTDGRTDTVPFEYAYRIHRNTVRAIRINLSDQMISKELICKSI